MKMFWKGLTAGCVAVSIVGGTTVALTRGGHDGGAGGGQSDGNRDTACGYGPCPPGFINHPTWDGNGPAWHAYVQSFYPPPARSAYAQVRVAADKKVLKPKPAPKQAPVEKSTDYQEKSAPLAPVPAIPRPKPQSQYAYTRTASVPLFDDFLKMFR